MIEQRQLSRFETHQQGTLLDKIRMGRIKGTDTFLFGTFDEIREGFRTMQRFHQLLDHHIDEGRMDGNSQ